MIICDNTYTNYAKKIEKNSIIHYLITSILFLAALVYLLATWLIDHKLYNKYH